MARPAAQGQGGRLAEPGRRSSPFRALVWKEWREQRLIWAALLALSLAAVVAVRLAPARSDLRADLWLLIPTLWGGMAAMLGANAFAGERETDTESFAGALPVSRRFRFWVKIGVIAGLLWIAQLLTAGGMPAVDWSGQSLAYDQYFRYYLYVSFTFGMLLLSLTSACVAAWSGTAMMALIQTAIFGPCLVLWTAWMGKLFFAVVQYEFSSALRARWFALFVSVGLAQGILLLCARWLWTATPRGFLRHVRRAAAAVFIFVIVSAVPSVAGYFLVTAARPALPTLWHPFNPSPAGRYALCRYGWLQGWLRDGVYILDTENSRTIQLSRFHENGLRSDGIWSPDGSKFIFYMSDDWACPPLFTHYFPRLSSGSGKLCWADAATGKIKVLRSVPSSVNKLPSSVELKYWLCCWWDDHTVAFREGHGIVFKDIHTGAERVCSDNREARAGDEFSGFIGARATGGGIWTFGYLHNGGGAFHGYRPDAAEASVVRPRWHKDLGHSSLSAISLDGRWALLYWWEDFPHGGQRSLLCSLETGETCDIDRELSSNEGEKGIRIIGGFTPDSQAILMGDSTRIGLWSLATRKFELLHTSVRGAITDERIASLSPSGKYLLTTMVRLWANNTSPAGELESVVTDVATKRSRPVWKPAQGWRESQWLGDDELLVDSVLRWKDKELEVMPLAEDYSVWVVNRDGTSKRKVLP
ncbi:MAG: hypothetical protein ABSA67_05145 [Candidatus Brocadiia bacterium]